MRYAEKVFMQMVFKASVRLGDLIFQQSREIEESVVPGSTEASDRRYPL